MKVLIGEISSYKAIVIAHHLHEKYKDVVLVAYDNKRIIRRIHTKYVDDYIPIKLIDTESYIQELADCVKKNKIDVFVPVHSNYIGEILSHKELFGHTLDYLGGYYDYLQLHEKDRLMKLAVSCGIRVPKNYETVEDAVPPFVMKPKNQSSAKGVVYFMSDKEKMRYLERKEERGDAIVQEYVEGQGCGYSVYCKEGKIMLEYGHLRLAEHPVSGGSSVYRVGYMHPEMRTISKKILEKVPWTGFAMFEFKLTPQGELVLIEVNPRIWGSINQALQDGIPFFSYALGKAEDVNCDIIRKKRTCLSPQVYISLIGYLLKGDFSRIKDYFNNKGITIADVSFWNDPKGYVSLALRKL